MLPSSQQAIEENNNLERVITELFEELAQKNSRISQLSGLVETANLNVSNLSQELHLQSSIAHTQQKQLLREIYYEFEGDEVDDNQNFDALKLKIVNQIHLRRIFADSEIVQGEAKQFIFDQLKAFNHSRPVKTTLLYRHYSQRNMNNRQTQNIPSLISKREHLIIFVKFHDGVVVGGYTVFPFDPDRNEYPGNGFLFRLNDRKIFRKKETHRVPVAPFDPYYFILGNAELRIRYSQNTAFSNFGIPNAVFESNGQMKFSFFNCLNQREPEKQFEIYEIFQLAFTN